MRLFKQISACFILFLAISKNFQGQESKLRIFGQPGFDYTYNTKIDRGSPYFRGGPWVLFATSQLTEQTKCSG